MTTVTWELLSSPEVMPHRRAEPTEFRLHQGIGWPPWDSFRLEQHEVSMPERAASSWRPLLAAVPSFRSCAAGLRSAALVAEGSSSEDVGEQG